MINNIFKILLGIFILTLNISCEKRDGFVPNYDDEYVNWDKDLTFLANGNEFNYCGIFLNTPGLTSTYYLDTLSPYYGRLRIKGNSFDKCDYYGSVDFNEIMLLSFKSGAIEPKLGEYDLKETFLIDDIAYVHYGNDIYNYTPSTKIDQTFDKIIDGEFIVDSILMPLNQDSIYYHGKLFGSFWVDLGMSEESLSQGNKNDTMEIRAGRFQINI